MTPKAQVEYRNIAELHELPGNPRTIKKDQFEKLKKSLTDNADYFEARPIILSDRTGQLVILAGNQRYKAAKALGLEQVPTITLHGLTEEREREIVIRDNVNNGEWDMDALANEWDAGQLLDWGVEIPTAPEQIADIIEDQAPEADESKPAMTKLGEIYKLGNHRLMVGDSTKAEDVQKLMNGEQADLLVTDPPYNVAYQQEGSGSGCRAHYQSDKAKTIMNDKFESDEAFEAFLTDAFMAAFDAIKPGAPFYFWHAAKTAGSFTTAVKNCGEEYRQQLIWVKSTLVLGRQDYQWIHEPCLYGWKSGAGHYFRDIRTETTVFDDERDPDEMSKRELADLVRAYRGIAPTSIIREKKPAKSEEHPTMKPVKLIARLVANSSREHEKVLDVFGGSGTTLIACEQLARDCYIMELDPHYADVIIKRWENLTGKKAERITE